MALLTCDVCGNKLIGKPDGIFECSSCGIEYSIEWAKQKLQSANIQVSTNEETKNISDEPVSVNVNALVKRGNMALLDRKWDEAEKLFKQALNINAENADAYIGLCMVSAQCHNKKEYETQWPISRNQNKNDFQRAATYASGDLAVWISNLIKQTNDFYEKANSMRIRIKSTFSLIASGCSHTIGLKTDGTVFAVGDPKHGLEDIDSSVPCALYWTNIKSVYAGWSSIWGLRYDGTVASGGGNIGGYPGYHNWKDVVDVAIGPNHIVGLMPDGKVKFESNLRDDECHTEEWTDIVSVAAGPHHIIGVKSDGTALMTADKYAPQYDVSDWKNIVAVFAGEAYTIGLRSDGTVEAIEYNQYDHGDGYSGYHAVKCVECEKWTNIVAVSIGGSHAVGLKSDCTVVAIGKNDDSQCDVSSWTNIIAVSAGSYHTVGLRSDGTVVAIGANRQGECDVKSWKLFQSLPTITQEQEDGRRNLEKTRCEIERKILLKENQSLLTERMNLQKELANSKGLFAKLLRADNEEKLVKVEGKLKDNNNRLNEINRYLKSVDL